MNYFITAIGTDSGKTLVSSILCEAFHADYWKPVQSGFPRDSETVEKLISNKETKIHPETYLLKTPVSPHAAAKADGVNISLQSFKMPQCNRALIIEGAGGCLVPLNDKDFMIDLMAHLETEVILVANLYLGSINHTFLSIEALQKRNIKIMGLIFNGEPNPESERIILLHSKLPCLLRIQKEKIIDRSIILKYAEKIKEYRNE
jgi:dethiobiotin synthetase